MAVSGYGLAAAYDGSSWSAPVTIDPTSAEGGAAVTAVSCASSSFCVAVDGSGRAMTYDGSSWSPPSDIDGSSRLTSVSCPSSSFCAAADDRGNVVIFSGGSWGGATSVDGANHVNSISCSGVSLCAAVDNAGGAVVYDGMSWSARVLIDAGAPITGVSCASTTFCAAVADGQKAVVFDGSSWSAPVSIAGLSPDAVSCVSSLFCAEVDYYGNVVTYDGSTWSGASQIGAFGGADALTSVSCATTSFCVAIDSSGQFIRSSASQFPQTITFTSAAPNPALAGESYTPTATGGTSGNPVLFSIDSSSIPGACSISSGTVSFTGIGTCVIDANQAGNANYTAAPQAQQMFTIARGPQSITFASTPPTNPGYGGNYTVSATGGGSGNPVIFSIDSASDPGACSISSTTVSFTGLGKCVIDANQAGNAAYYPAPQVQQSFTIVKATTSLAAPPARNDLLWITFQATLTRTDNGAGIPGKTLVFTVQGHQICHATTNSSGVARCTVIGLAIITAQASYTASFAGDADYLASSANGKL